jgi:hypothetical protein
MLDMNQKRRRERGRGWLHLAQCGSESGDGVWSSVMEMATSHCDPLFCHKVHIPNGPLFAHEILQLFALPLLLSIRARKLMGANGYHISLLKCRMLMFP